MQVNISARHGNIAEETRAKITEKVSKLSRFLDRITAIDVTVDLEEKETPVVDVQVHTEYRKDFVAQSQPGELFISLDEVNRKLEQQLKKYKEKLISSHRAE
ncbi:MAG: ribosome-associated translation inhibitor RaiA [Planctomycetia bacterium]|nr:ribosome-associated translation inhibitor RaiA [Planctomycetia bacterium]